MTWEAWASLAAKVVGTAATVMIASVAAERSGPFWGGLIASLPVVAGPSYVLLALQAGTNFIARSALSSFSALSAVALFSLILVLGLPRLGAVPTFVVAFGAWIGTALLLFEFPPTLTVAIIVNIAVFAVCIGLTGKAWRARPGVQPLVRHWADLPVRAGLIGLFVAGVVIASAAIGQIATGISAMFPLSLASLGVIVYARLGAHRAASTMASAIRGIIGLGLALLVLHVTVEAMGTSFALVAALAAALAWSALMIVWRRSIT